MIIIIRASNERTLQACYNTFYKGFPTLPVLVVSKSPFIETIRECYRLGTECKCQWMITCDADILPNIEGTKRLISNLPNLSDDVVYVRGKCDDWLFGKIRTGGIQIYNTKFIPALYQNLYDIERPESSAIKATGNIVSLNIFTGIHDKEQYYKDVFRKIWHHKLKHKNDPNFKLLTQRIETHCKIHDDFKVAKVALETNVTENFKPLDSTTFPDITNVLEKLNLVEKEEYGQNGVDMGGR